MRRYYINLTAGLAHPFSLLHNAIFAHMLSSHLEAGDFNGFLLSVPDDLLLHLALGVRCIIVDASANKSGCSKVIRIGIPLLRLVLRKRWWDRLVLEKTLDKKQQLFVLNNLSRKVKRRIDYYKSFLMCDDVSLDYICLPLPKEDGDETIKAWLRWKTKGGLNEQK